MSIVDGDILGDVVRALVPSDPNVTRVRYSAGTLTPTGERNGRTSSTIEFAALVTSGKSRMVRNLWGELADDEALLLLDSAQLDGGLADLVVGDVVEYRSTTYEVKERRIPDLDSETPYVRVMVKEVQNHGDV